VNARGYAQPAACAAYAAAHAGAAGFGCGPRARRVAIALPGLGLPLLVVAALAVVWVPDHSTGRRGALLGVLALVLVACAAIAAAAYGALPPDR